MLKQLIINNLILIDSLQISFQEGFNVLTGETGAGKSAVMSALKLITGARADTKMVRKDTEKTTVEAMFDPEKLTNIQAILEEAGIDMPANEDLIIKRELFSSGKSRAYINHQMAHVSLLKEIGEQLVEIVGQHANQRLYDEDEHRNILDLFGDCTEPRLVFAKTWKKLHTLQKKVSELHQNEAFRLREIERLRAEIEEITTVNPIEDEEEELFSEYSFLTHAEEIFSSSRVIHAQLHGGKESLVIQLSRNVSTLESLMSLDPSLSELHQSLHDATCEIEEVAHSIRNYMTSIDNDPHRAEVINDRLSTIDKLRRKFGPTLPDVYQYKKDAEEQLKRLENADIEIEELEIKLETLKVECNTLAEKLTGQRIKASKKLERQMTAELRELNMPKVEFKIDITKQTRSAYGDDKVAFLMAPNVGERVIPIKDCASGGEISRLLLAIEKLLSSKNATTTIVFDEIDGNIGGETAVVVGKKLEEIGQAHQVMCITHFPQVASQANHHYKIEKVEKSGRTLSLVTRLDEDGKKGEINRMLGHPTSKQPLINHEEREINEEHAKILS
jgi:DNA repair protein RecN (Recombination protein N)